MRNTCGRRSYTIALLWTVLLTVSFGTASGQQFEQAYEDALLDRLVRYERLKPVYHHLQTAYELQSKQVQDLRDALRWKDLHGQLQVNQCEAQLADLRRTLKRKRLTATLKVAGAILVTVTLFAL